MWSWAPNAPSTTLDVALSLGFEESITVGSRTNSPKWLTDLEATYRLGPTLTLGVGAQNIFNVFPCGGHRGDSPC